VILPPYRPRLAGAFIAVSLLLGLWALVTAVSGGFRFEIGSLVVSSRNPVRPAIAALAFALVALAFDRVRARTILREALDVVSRATRFIVPLTVIGVLLAAVQFGARAASGADESGYVSQSVLWLHGKLRIEQPVAAGLPWPNVDATLSPLGYRHLPVGHALVPTYAPGLPILMAGARLFSTCAPFFIVPICAAMLVLFTWLLGRRVFGEVTGIAGSVMVAASPVVLMLMLAPITDVPVAAFWMGALFFADVATIRSAAVAGVLAGIAAWIRPNLAPLALFPLILTIVPGGSRRAIVGRAIALCTSAAPFAVFLGLLHQSLYGSPFSSGYGDISTIYSLHHFPENARRYAAWWWHVEGVAGWLFVIGVFRPRPPETRWRVLTLVAFAVAVGLSYMFYLSFHHWGFLRFVLSAVPIAVLLSADAVVWIASTFGTRVTAVALAVVTIVTAIRGIELARSENVFVEAADEQRYADGGVYVNEVTPDRSVVLTMQHSGSVRYYSGRLVLRYDLLDPAWLDRALDALEARGFSISALLEDWEERDFRARFAAERSTRVLDAGPHAIRRSGVRELRFFILRGPGARPGGPPARMPTTSPSDCPPVSPNFVSPPGE
jgi:dolichyl-phosphate-mannose-protein mannosyltransferase